MDRIRVLVCALAGLGLSWSALPRPAQACGGLFCNASQPVNQAAERILFTENGDGTVTAVIEIQYEGPSKSFSWLLPVPGVPEVGFSSTLAFDRLQQNSNPTYMLQTTFEGTCGGGNTTAASPRALAGGAPTLESTEPQRRRDRGRLRQRRPLRLRSDQGRHDARRPPKTPR